MAFGGPHSRQLGAVMRFGGFYSALVKEFGDPKSKMAGLSGVLLGMVSGVGGLNLNANSSTLSCSFS